MQPFIDLAKAGLVTPKQPNRLTVILSDDEVRALLSAAGTRRDQVLLCLMYGSGLRPGEVRMLRWSDFDLQTATLGVAGPPCSCSRRVPVPTVLLPVLTEGAGRCDSSAFIFRGRWEERPVSKRMVEFIVRRAARRAGVLKGVSAMTLRHTFAVHALASGWSIRRVQQTLGHATITTTLQYQRCASPTGARSPLDIRLGDPAAAPGASMKPATLAPPLPSRGSRQLPFPLVQSTARERAARFYRLFRMQMGNAVLSRHRLHTP